MTGEKILIVDDEVSEAIATRKLLRKNEFDISGLVINIVDAIQQAGADKPDLVLMKIGIKGSMDVIDAASKIIANYNLPILFIVGDNDIDVISKIKKLNNPVIVIAPYTEIELVKSINIALTRHAAERKAQQEKESANVDPIQTELAAIPAPALTINKRGAITRINKDMEFLTKLTRNELVGRKITSLISTSDAGETAGEEDAGDEEESITGIWPDKVQIKLADGSVKKVVVMSGFLKDYGDNLDEMVLIFKKVTGEVEFSTKDIDVIFAKVLNSLEDMVFVLNKDMEITHYNSRFFKFAKRLGITEFQLERPIYEISQFSKIASVNIYEELFRTSAETKQLRRYGSEKEPLYMLFRFIPLISEGETTHMITVMRDITEIEESRQKSKSIYEEFMKNRSLISKIQSGMSDIRSSMYQIIKFVEKNPERATSPSFKQMAKLTKNAEQKLLAFDVVWSKYETQINMMQMNSKYKMDKINKK
ncbi:MAG: PAS domain-containing protein [Methanomicrobium sp.]|nr:PAS domain-containing protein [Methanomicrobium sp.]